MNTQNPRDPMDYNGLRQLHKLYGKCKPARLLDMGPGLVIGLCSCGKLLKPYPGAINPHTYLVEPSETWYPISHQDKKRLQRAPRYKECMRNRSAHEDPEAKATTR